MGNNGIGGTRGINRTSWEVGRILTAIDLQIAHGIARSRRITDDQQIRPGSRSRDRETRRLTILSPVLDIAAIAEIPGKLCS